MDIKITDIALEKFEYNTEFGICITLSNGLRHAVALPLNDPHANFAQSLAKMGHYLQTWINQQKEVKK